MKQVYVKKNGEGPTVLEDFRNLKKGDIVFVKGAAHRLKEDAHLCGDSTYDGYLAYDMDGESLFSEDIDSQE